MTARPAVELLPPTTGGRTFTARRTVRLGDVDPDGVLRLDAIGRYLQDVASDDALDARLPNALGWVVRRTLVQVVRPARAGDEVELTTFCSGAGRSWAERRTSLRSTGGASIEAVSLWIQVDVGTGRPARLGEVFDHVYGTAAAGRVVSSKLALPSRPTGEAHAAGRWQFRRTDLDQFGHVNNAAQFAVLEQVLDGSDRRGTAEVEYLGPADADASYRLLVDAGDEASGSGPHHWWLVDDEAATAVTAFSWRPLLR